MNVPLDSEEFTADFFNHGRDDAVLVDVGGRDPIAVKVHPSRSKRARALVILFHGAVARSNGAEIPSFLNARRPVIDFAHQISIADPGVESDNKVGIGWFAGSEYNPSQRLLPEFFKHVQEALQVERVIFVGSSAGGFGALFYSWNMPGSIACVSVPQTSAWDYYESTIRRYLDDCWPKGLGQYADPPMLDVRDLYSRSVPNTVIYVQSSLDDRHLHQQMVPFLSAINPEDRHKIALKVSYWGRTGHSGAVPPGELDGWIRAAISAAEPFADSIITQYQRSGVESTPLSQTLMRQSGAGVVRTPRGKGTPAQEDNFQDIMWARLVAESHIAEGDERGHESI